MSTTSLLNSLAGSASAATAANLSSILQAATGASSAGIDVTAAVSSAVTAARAPEDTWNSQIGLLQSQSTALTTLQSQVTNLDNDMQALNRLTGPLAATIVTSSNTTVVTATSASGSATGNNVVVVNNLAITASFASTPVSSVSTALPVESFTIANHGGTAATITTGSGVNTLADLQTAINGAGLGLTANVINDSSGSRIAIASNTSGSSGNFTVTSTGTGFTFAQAATGINASLTVNGIDISSASNTVTGAAPGLILNLLGVSPTGSSVSLSVEPDTATASAAINQFVTDYNTVISGLNSEFANTSGSGQGSLAQDPTIRNLQAELLQVLSYTAAPAVGSSTTTVPNLTSMGLSVNADGSLSVDNSKLTSVLQSNFNGVQNFFQGASLNGFGGSLYKQLTSFINPADGAFTVDLQSIGTQTRGLNADIATFELNVITPLRKQLQSDLSQAEILLQQLPTLMKQISTELGQNTSSTGG
jgi:flagellar hook-associated protein 2